MTRRSRAREVALQLLKVSDEVVHEARYSSRKPKLRDALDDGIDDLCPLLLLVLLTRQQTAQPNPFPQEHGLEIYDELTLPVKVKGINVLPEMAVELHHQVVGPSMEVNDNRGLHHLLWPKQLS